MGETPKSRIACSAILLGVSPRRISDRYALEWKKCILLPNMWLFLYVTQHSVVNLLSVVEIATRFWYYRTLSKQEYLKKCVSLC